MFKTYFYLFLALNFNLYPITIESPTIKSISRYLSKDCLIILDIDNTLIEPKTQEGSDQWFSAVVKWATKKGIEKPAIYEKLLPYYFDLHHSLHYKPVEKETRKYINQLHKHNYQLVGLTSRSPEILDHTLRELKESKIDLSNSWKDYCFQKYEGIHHEAHFKQGIILCGRNPKGDILKTFLKTNKLNPTKIIMVDDKAYNLEAVEKMASELDIEFIGIRFSGLDNKVKNFVLKDSMIPESLR